MTGSSCSTVKVSDEPFLPWHVRLHSILAAKMGYLGAVISFCSANLSVSEVSRQNLLDSWKGIWTQNTLGIWLAGHMLLSWVPHPWLRLIINSQVSNTTICKSPAFVVCLLPRVSPRSGSAWKVPGVFGLGLMRCLFQFGFEKLDEKNTGDKPTVVPDEDLLQ